MIKPFISKDERMSRFKNMKQSKKFNGTFWILGGGSIGTSIIFLLLHVFTITEKNIVLFDKDPNVGNKIKKHYENIKFINVDIVRSNYKQVLENIKKDDIVIDCSYCINTKDLLKLCNEKGCSYINSSIEDWEDDPDDENPINNTLMAKCIGIEDLGKQLPANNTNFLVSMGCNPGNVSIWTKLALHLINNQDKYKHEYKTFGELAHKLGVNVVHISEKDTQITRDPKKHGEYCNTWSGTGESMYEEACASAEGSWGTHEGVIPKDADFDPIKNNNYLSLKRRGMSTHLMSYTPISKNYIGMMVRHDESFTIGRELSYYENGKLLHKPSVYYVYRPTDSTLQSFYELRERNMEYQKTRRLLTHDIISGTDELGVTLFLNNGEIYWIGSLLDIDEAREFFGKEHVEIINATVLQVIAGYLSGIMYIVDLINDGLHVGVMCPDDLPFKKLFKYSGQFFGNFIITQVDDWDYNNKFNNRYNADTIEIHNKWQFGDFLINM
ncbi:saccharopine dehydrogenase NADP-binding domain protein [Fadolivirus algeromassiliense]|jgi:homospermidine synthase|uniref:Saccharopine dehydrogenase NADP-binding domain protein n=1 Tax=Fadolivirus FV1/VV64 TaxID=3070911 RepID=A0A7D3R1I1_9VIRU|nr:saccharopine dehydrogenase NADP-binding domain protein [Fadolivirus algeromassiliense]QKF94401.1 saccharopine dehydrogenase NADP-binding domain protein [Fadolivirus FV1/VV64]